MTGDFKWSDVTDLAKNDKNWREKVYQSLFEKFGESEAMEVAIAIQADFPGFKDWLYQKGKGDEKI